MVTVALVDDHAIVRQGLHALLESDPTLKVVGEAASGLEAIKLVKRRKPEVVVCDLIMPGLNGLETARKLLRLKLKTQVIMLSMYRNEAYVLEALKVGAAGYVVKESSGAELFQAIRMAAAGQRYVSPTLSKAPAIASYLRKTQPVLTDPYETLTTREQEVLQLVVQWGTRRDIGAKLKISPSTVESHQANLMRKLGLNTHHNLIQYVLKRGIVPMDAQKSLRKKDAHTSEAELRDDAPESSVPPVNRTP
jgi:DNA-binding NarL/FixJ family response regulator